MKFETPSMVALLALANLCGGPAGGASTGAGDDLFGDVRTATPPALGAWDVHAETTGRFALVNGSESPTRLRFAADGGIGRGTQLSLRLAGSSLQLANAPRFADGTQRMRDWIRIDGCSLAIKSTLLAPGKDDKGRGRVGMALYFEPGYSRLEALAGTPVLRYELEIRLIVEQRFLGERGVWSSNFLWSLARERRRDASGFTNSFREEISSGAVVRLSSGWSAGAEGRVGMGDSQLAWLLGPNVHYGAARWWFTLTVLPQIHGWPYGGATRLDPAQLDGAEVRFKVGVPLLRADR